MPRRVWLEPGSVDLLRPVSLADNETQWKRYVTDSLIETVLSRDVLQRQTIAKPALLCHLSGLGFDPLRGEPRFRRALKQLGLHWAIGR